jgi:hypothetical protein
MVLWFSQVFGVLGQVLGHSQLLEVLNNILLLAIVDLPHKRRLGDMPRFPGIHANTSKYKTNNLTRMTAYLRHSNVSSSPVDFKHTPKMDSSDNCVICETVLETCHDREGHGN